MFWFFLSESIVQSMIVHPTIWPLISEEVKVRSIMPLRSGIQVLKMRNLHGLPSDRAQIDPSLNMIITTIKQWLPMNLTVTTTILWLLWCDELLWKNPCTGKEHFFVNLLPQKSQTYLPRIFPSNSSHETEDILEEEEDLLDETPFSLPIYAKPLPLLGHPSRHSVLNR